MSLYEPTFHVTPVIYVLYSNETYISCIMSCGNEIVSNRMIGYGLYISTLILFNTYLLRCHHNSALLHMLNSPLPHLFEHLLALVDIFSINISTSYSVSVPYTPFRLISWSSPHSMTKCLMVSSSLPHSRQSTAHLWNRSSTLVSGYWLFIKTIWLNHIHLCIYPHPQCFSYSYKASALFYSPYLFFFQLFTSLPMSSASLPPHIWKVQPQFP